MPSPSYPASNPATFRFGWQSNRSTYSLSVSVASAGESEIGFHRLLVDRDRLEYLSVAIGQRTHVVVKTLERDLAGFVPEGREQFDDRGRGLGIGPPKFPEWRSRFAPVASIST